jgi:enoyl-CoA hydratase/carnithine racemase
MVTMFQEVGRNSDIRVVLFRASKGSKAFTAGLDLEFAASLADIDEGDDNARAAYKNFDMISKMQASFTMMEKIPQPVVCAIDGAVIGGGRCYYGITLIKYNRKHA